MFLLKTDVDYNRLQFSLALNPQISLMDSTVQGFKFQSSKKDEKINFLFLLYPIV